MYDVNLHQLASSGPTWHPQPMRIVYALVALLAVAAAVAIYLRSGPEALRGAPVVWLLDDGHRVHAGQGTTPLMDENPLWRAGAPAPLFGLREETIAFQVIVSAGDGPLSSVEVTLSGFEGVARVTRSVVHELDMKRRSGGRFGNEALNWDSDAQPPDPPMPSLPDPLLPVAHAPAWADYPMTVAAGRHRALWVELYIAPDAAPGIHRGELAVRDSRGPLTTIPIALELLAVRLPYRALATMVFFATEEIEGRVASKDAVRSHQQLMHAHHLDTIFTLRSADDVRRHADALTGALYDDAHGYAGPGRGVGASVVVLGAYGVLRDPSPESLAAAEGMLAALAELGITDEPGRRDVFLYTIDEQCESPRTPAWRRALAESDSPTLRALRIGHTCSKAPASQPVDLVMMAAGHFRPDAPRSDGQRVWIYNGRLPTTGDFFSDGWSISLRANAWIQAHHDIERWFYWESTFWNDDNRGGLGPYDPLLTAETFHNDDGDHCNGDGVLVYPGKQSIAGYRSLGLDTVLPSLRLAQWRRGIQDAGYLELARARDRVRADAIARELVGRAFEATDTPLFPTDSAPYRRARRALFDILAE